MFFRAVNRKLVLLALPVILSTCQKPCAEDGPPSILGEVSVEMTATTATIEWVTDEPATTQVLYGTSTGYGSLFTNEAMTREHSAYVTGLTPGTTYHYAVRCTDRCLFVTVTEDAAFTTLSDEAISPPAIVDEPDGTSTGSYEAVLEWSTVATPSGSVAEYLVEVDDDALFGSVDHASDWISGASWSVTVDTGFTHFWRVRARDSSDTSVVSEWSSTDSFSVRSSDAPPAPIPVPEPDTMSGGMSYTVSLDWSAVTDPDGDPVEYQAQMSYSVDFTSPSHESGWISGRAWSLTIPPGGMWYWRVQARDADHIDAVSPWSTVDSFYDMTMPGSCPFLFAWTGDGYDYLTDIQGPAIGLPASVLTTQNIKHYRPEYVVLEGLQEDGSGRTRIKIRETQTEITYVDELELLVVDHPEGSRIVSSTAESTYSYGYADPFVIVTTGDPRPPVSVTNKKGQGVLEALARKDGVIADATSPYIVLDFGTIKNPEHARLVIDGWSVYDRRKYPSKKLVQPFVEVRSKKGKWIKARSFGNPAGDMKRMAVDISGLLRSDDHRIRIHMGKVHAIRWVIDSIALDDSEPVTVVTKHVRASLATLSHGGLVPHSRANLVHPTIARDDSMPDNEHAWSYGSFTRYGDVLELLESADDTFAILRHGDALEVFFPAVERPAKGMRRTYVLVANLFYKHLSLSDLVTPLPYQGMGTYPCSGYPEDAEHAAYLEEYQTRTYEKPPLP
ncbi:MAG: fibronectin type III domain-containing protein [Deltaproteobacteria bacterium]|nr:fibronectin type III domain-containing protein [Deltaproteobacteria bacterium]